MVIPVLVCAALAAFVPRIAHRLAVPHGTPPRARCADCSRPFPAGPSGWVHPGAACRCGPVPWRIVGTAAGAAGLTAGFVGSTALVVVLVPVVLLGVLLAEIDLHCLRLPDPLVAALTAMIVVPLLAMSAASGQWGRLGQSAAAAGLALVLHLIVAVGGGLGLGDVKLAAALGFLLGWAGWPTVLLGLVLPHLINGPAVLVLLIRRRITRRTAVPLGPALLAGSLLAVVATGG